MNTGIIEMKKCKECGGLFPKTIDYFHKRTAPTGRKVFESYCKECGRLRRRQWCWKKKAKLVKVIEKPVRETSRQAFSIESLKGNVHRCVRCDGVLEERDMKYEPGISGEILGKYIYYNCPFCGQDYYPEEKGVCECVGSGT
jgi:uncharacterized protein with PIN domain